jgi:predicted  nucleic acid-binding Zn-ribbon protein
VQARAVAAEHEVADLKARATAHFTEMQTVCSDLQSAEDRLALSANESDSLRHRIEELDRSIAQIDTNRCAAELRIGEAEAECARAIAAAESIRAAFDSAKLQYCDAAAKLELELAGAREKLAVADLSIAFLRNSSKGKDDTITRLRAEYESINGKLGLALANDAAFSGLKIALHEANSQRASLMKSISDSQKKIAELTGENDALNISITQLERERDGLLDEIQEYRQVMAIADCKINEFEALHARMLQPSAAPHVAQAWNLSEPARAVQQTDTYVLQSSPQKAPSGKAVDSAGALPDDGGEVDEYDDMLQVDANRDASCGFCSNCFFLSLSTALSCPNLPLCRGRSPSEQTLACI